MGQNVPQKSFWTRSLDAVEVRRSKKKSFPQSGLSLSGGSAGRCDIYRQSPTHDSLRRVSGGFDKRNNNNIMMEFMTGEVNVDCQETC